MRRQRLLLLRNIVHGHAGLGGGLDFGTGGVVTGQLPGVLTHGTSGGTETTRLFAVAFAA